MTSIYKPLIKVLLISIMLATSISFSAFTTVKQSYNHSIDQKIKTTNETSKKVHSDEPVFVSEYELKIKHDIHQLTPGSKKFNARYLYFVLSNPKKQTEA